MPRSGEPTRQTILDAAYGLFRRKGFTRVSMDEIAAATAVTKRTLYYHFAEQGRASRRRARSPACACRWRPSGPSATACRLARSHDRQRCSRISPSGRTSRAGPARASRALSSSLPICRGHPARLIARRHKAMLEASSRRPSGARPTWPRQRTRPRNLAALRRRNLLDPRPWRPQLRFGRCRSGQEAHSIRICLQKKTYGAIDADRAKERA